VRAALLLAALALGCHPQVPLPVDAQPRFTDLGDGTVRDGRTSLVWARSANLPGVAGPFEGLTWDEALAFVTDMNAGTRPNLGHTDWRLPRVEELVGLLDAFWVAGSGLSCTAAGLDGGCRFRVPFAPFADVAESGYWSGTSATGPRWSDGRGSYVPTAAGASAGDDPPDAWCVDGRAEAFPVTKAARRSLWPVRGAAPAE
jgi:hypothetical protein